MHADQLDLWVTNVIERLRDRGQLSVDLTKKLVSAASVPSGANLQFVEPALAARVAASGQMLEGFRKVMGK